MIGRKDIRLPNYDYSSNGFYFVTIVTRVREKYLENQEQVFERECIDLARKIPGLGIDYKVLMADHVHIIFVLDNCQLKLGEIVRRLKAKISRALGKHIWEVNYYEHIIRNETALNHIREYIMHNPELLDIKISSIYADKSARYASKERSGRSI